MTEPTDVKAKIERLARSFNSWNYAEVIDALRDEALRLAEQSVYDGMAIDGYKEEERRLAETITAQDEALSGGTTFLKAAQAEVKRLAAEVKEINDVHCIGCECDD